MVRVIVMIFLNDDDDDDDDDDDGVDVDVGDCQLNLFRPSHLQVKLQPGDMLYIMDGKYHGGVNVGKRVVSENFRACSDLGYWFSEVVKVCLFVL